MENIKCDKCQGQVFYIVPKVFANGVAHREARCAACGAHLQYVKSTDPVAPEPVGKDGLAFKFGKHAGKTIAQAFDQDPQYVKWAAENWKNLWFKQQLMAFLEKNAA